MCSVASDPDQGFFALTELAEVWDLHGMDPENPGWRRLVALLGGSATLGRWLKQRPQDAEVCFEDDHPWDREAIHNDLLERIGFDGTKSPESGILELRWAYRRHLMRIASRDLSHPDPQSIVDLICQELSDLDDAVVEAAVTIAKTQVPEYELVRLGILALGKTGAQEVNYLSDVDVIFVAEPQIGDEGPLCTPQEAVRIATLMATKITATCSTYTAAGSIWELDANLRPEGAAGALVRTLSGMKTYYTTWAKNWEFQAMLKARPMAGDLDLAQEFVDLVSPLVWSAAENDGFVSQAQVMRGRVVSYIPQNEKNREIKLSQGGLRDTEFSVQLLQLVHGRTDERLRVRGTLAGLNLLVAHGYVGRGDGAELDQAYRFQRLLEHRLQLYNLKRTHLMPEDPQQLRRLARSVGLKEADQVVSAWRASAVLVLKLHLKIYYSPLLAAVARIPTEEIKLTPEAAAERLRGLGYADPRAALRHIESLTQGMSRRAEILRQLLPALLGWIASGPNPDAGLLAFRQMADSLGSTPFFLRALRDEGKMAQDLALILSTSRYASSLLQRSPASAEMLIGNQDRVIPSRESLSTEFSGLLTRYGTDTRLPEIIRATRRRELLRIAMEDILGHITTTEVGRHLSDLNGEAISAALKAAQALYEDPPEMSIIALGRWGGQEMAYSSDADILVVLEDSDDPEMVRKGTKILADMRKILKVPGPDPDLEIDIGLRPEGKDGPLVRTLHSSRTYYEKWAATWESQALVRARFGGGNPDLGHSLLTTIDTLRYPEGGITQSQLVEIRRLKARMESERITKGTDPRFHVKLGPGGLSDIEWTIQVIQLAHAWKVESLRVTGTLEALDAALEADLIKEIEAESLRESFILASRIRNTITLVKNQSSDVLTATDLPYVSTVMGFEGSSLLAEEWLRVSRKARDVANRLFWGIDA
jgi:glutamate-ammonia-ligase adenylyltransferase